jgi:hypothetical protein
VRRKFTFYAYGSDIGDVAREAGRLDAVFISRRSKIPEPILLDEPDLTPGSHVLIAPKAGPSACRRIVALGEEMGHTRGRALVRA